MIGNDVVDLELAKKQSNWKRPGFLEKVFTASEQAAIATAEDPDLYVWLLWSLKEAAYKAHQRRFNLPRRLKWKAQETEISEFSASRASGVVRIGEELYFTLSEISREFIFTSAVNTMKIHLESRVLKSPSEEVKELFLKSVAEKLLLPLEELYIIKNVFGVPVLQQNHNRLSTAFSFTGHGRFNGFSFPLTNC